MKSIKYITLVATLVLLMGCATTFRPWKLSEITKGMDRAQVIQILGEPTSVEMNNGEEFLYYSYRENYNPPLANDSVHAYEANRNLRTKQIQKSLEESNYFVILLNGKVLNYKEVQD